MKAWFSSCAGVKIKLFKSSLPPPFPTPSPSLCPSHVISPLLGVRSRSSAPIEQSGTKESWFCWGMCSLKISIATVTVTAVDTFKRHWRRLKWYKILMYLNCVSGPTKYSRRNLIYEKIWHILKTVLGPTHSFVPNAGWATHVPSCPAFTSRSCGRQLLHLGKGGGRGRGTERSTCLS